MQIAECGKNVWVGNYQACDVRGPGFEKVVHVWRGEGGSMVGVCGHAREGREGGHRIVYSEGDRLWRSGIDVPALVDYCRGTEPLLVHCAAGMSRGPTFALLALVVRGLTTLEASVLVAEATLRYPTPCCPLINPHVYWDIQELERFLFVNGGPSE